MGRELFTVDLRGLRAALAARAAEADMTESDVLRSALATALKVVVCVPAIASSSTVDRAPLTPDANPKFLPPRGDAAHSTRCRH